MKQLHRPPQANATFNNSIKELGSGNLSRRGGPRLRPLHNTVSRGGKHI